MAENAWSNVAQGRSADPGFPSRPSSASQYAAARAGGAPSASAAASAVPAAVKPAPRLRVTGRLPAGDDAAARGTSVHRAARAVHAGATTARFGVQA
jgi:hypothetical protein